MSTLPQNYCSPAGEQYNIRHSTKIYQHKNNLKPLSLYFLEVSKAFDFVSNEAISKVCNRVGVPEIVHIYINHEYKDCSTCLKYVCCR